MDRYNDDSRNNRLILWSWYLVGPHDRNHSTYWAGRMIAITPGTLESGQRLYLLLKIILLLLESNLSWCWDIQSVSSLIIFPGVNQPSRNIKTLLGNRSKAILVHAERNDHSFFAHRSRPPWNENFCLSGQTRKHVAVASSPCWSINETPNNRGALIW